MKDVSDGNAKSVITKKTTGGVPSWLLALALCLSTVIVYLPATQCGFVWDDDRHIERSDALGTLDGLRRIWFEYGAIPQYYPLVHTTFWIEYQLWGFNASGYHVTNILLHAACAILLWRLLQQLQVPGAFLAAAIFALHPVHVESVAWISERKNTLSGLFYLSAAFLYLRFALDDEASVRIRRGMYVGALVLFACALFSKTVTVTLPAALLLVIWWKRGRASWRDVLPLIPMLVIALPMACITISLEKHFVGAVGPEWELTFVDRCLIAGRALWFYAAKLIWPQQLTFIYPRWNVDASVWWQYSFPMAFIAVVVALWMLRRRIGIGPLICVLLFAGTLFPALGFFNVYPMLFSFVADHFQYLASIAAITLFAALATQVMKSCPAYGVWSRSLVIAILLILSVLSWRQQSAYRNLEALWRDTLAKNPACWLAHNNLGWTVQELGRPEEALAHYQDALRINPDDEEAHHNWGTALEALGRPDEALAHYQHAVRIKPDFAGARNSLGNALQGLGRPEEALEHYQHALRINPDFAVARNNLGNILQALGRLEEALAHYRHALRINPNNAEALYNWGHALEALGRPEQALAHFQHAVRINPDFAEAHFNWGRALEACGRPEEALAHYQDAVRIKPDFANARNSLGNALQALGRPEEALAHYQHAVRIKPDFANAHYNWGNALVALGRPKEALAYYQNAVRIKPDYAGAHYNWGNALEATGRPEEALAHYQDALRIKPDDAAAYFKYGAVYGQLGKHELAVKNLDKAIELKPDFVQAYFIRGIVFAQWGKFELALDDYAKVIELKPNDTAAYNARGNLYVSLGKFGLAVSDYTMAIELKPTDAEAYNSLAWLLATSPDEKYRDGQKAVSIARRACELLGWKNAHVLDTLSAAYAESGQFAEAVKWQTKAIELAPAGAKAELQSHLQLYKAGKPYRQKAGK